MPPLGGRGTTREGTAGPSTAAGRLVRLKSYPEHRGPQSGAAVEALSGRARGDVYYSTHAKEKG